LNDSIASKRIDSLVYVVPKPTAALSVISGSSNACEGESIRLKNTTDQKLGDFAWFKDNVKMGVLDDSIITLGNVFLADSGTYFSTITYKGCQSISNSMVIKVNANPTADFAITNRDSCLATNTFETVNNATISVGTLTYSWKFGDGNSSNITTPIHSYTDTGAYTVELAVLSDKNCADTIRKTVNIWSSPVADFSIDASPQCFTGNNFTFTNGSSINAGGLSYFWDLGNGKTANSINTGDRYTSIDTFDVELIAVSNKNCADTITREAITSPNPVADFRIDVMDSCFENNSFDFVNQSTISTGTIFSNRWDFGNGNTANTLDSLNYSYPTPSAYTVQLIVESAAGCSDTISKALAVHPSPVVDFSIDDSIQCFNGHEINLASTSNIGAGSITTLNWDFGDNNTTSTSTPRHSYLDPGTYVVTLQVISDQNCEAETTKPVIIHPSPDVSFLGGVTCAEEELNFLNTSSISSGTMSDFEWTFGDGQTSQVRDPAHRYMNEGTYEVKLVVTSDQGCKDSLIDKTAATINAKPNADFSYATVSSFDAQTEMEFISLNSDGTVFTWWIDNALLGNTPNINHIFQDTGTFMVALHVGNANGCNDTTTKAVFVVPDAILQVPTSFSPNGDLLNDEFKPLGVRFVQEYSVEIFNRWGQKVYASNDPSQGWDGTINGSPAPTGQYLVTVIVIDYNNERVKYNGLLSLIR
jgi:gliding motility-associated-like protein